MLGHAAGGGAFSFKNGSTRFGSLHTGYPLIFPVILTDTGQQSKYGNQSQVSKHRSYLVFSYPSHARTLRAASEAIPSRGHYINHKGNNYNLFQLTSRYIYISFNLEIEFPLMLPWMQKRYEVLERHSSYQQVQASCKARPNTKPMIQSCVNLGGGLAKLDIEKVVFFSTSKTSSPTRNIGFCFRCSTKATSPIAGPLLQFIRITSYG